MSTLTVPESLFHEIQKRANLTGKTVDDEAAELIGRALLDDMREADLLAEIAKDREEMAQRGVVLTPEWIAEAKRWGRE
jgi:hypothetical protein